jgi:hypothetical protein
MKELLLVVSAIGTIYTVTSMIESMREGDARRKREEEMLTLLRAIDRKLSERRAA